MIREGIRMFKPPTGHRYKQVLKGGAHIRGYSLPEGTQMRVNILRMMRHRETFGPDAALFRPERWLDGSSDGEKLKEMAATVDVAFGHGTFQCLGKTFAVMGLNKIFVKLLRRFDFAIAQHDGEY
ncbi:cytochrome P450 [Phialemonium atrogriseum]|uniref:Cytochrome P450 n=1 Tax=Phialemonium atrogriseum TaxID=1093897 RepID=A0AAJ0FKE3_9PEZI|nr:cytochrome P450 [Phialemonium atrogriseum]KAK1763995.1 cytochrome P450 [Phialemonium atrogriseum]